MNQNLALAFTLLLFGTARALVKNAFEEEELDVRIDLCKSGSSVECMELATLKNCIIYGRFSASLSFDVFLDEDYRGKELGLKLTISSDETVAPYYFEKIPAFYNRSVQGKGSLLQESSAPSIKNDDENSLNWISDIYVMIDSDQKTFGSINDVPSYLTVDKKENVYFPSVHVIPYYEKKDGNLHSHKITNDTIMEKLYIHFEIQPREYTLEFIDRRNRDDSGDSDDDYDDDNVVVDDVGGGGDDVDKLFIVYLFIKLPFKLFYVKNLGDFREGISMCSALILLMSNIGFFACTYSLNSALLRFLNAIFIVANMRVLSKAVKIRLDVQSEERGQSHIVLPSTLKVSLRKSYGRSFTYEYDKKAFLFIEIFLIPLFVGYILINNKIFTQLEWGPLYPCKLLTFLHLLAFASQVFVSYKLGFRTLPRSVPFYVMVFFLIVETAVFANKSY